MLAGEIIMRDITLAIVLAVIGIIAIKLYLLFKDTQCKIHNGPHDVQTSKVFEASKVFEDRIFSKKCRVCLMLDKSIENLGGVSIIDNFAEFPSGIFALNAEELDNLLLRLSKEVLRLSSAINGENK